MRISSRDGSKILKTHLTGDRICGAPTVGVLTMFASKALAGKDLSPIQNLTQLRTWTDQILDFT